MLKTPQLQKFRQGDLIQYMDNVLEILTEPRATTLNLSAQRENLYLSLRDLKLVWQPQVGSELTPEIVALDRKRDSIFSGLKITVDTWAMHHFNPDWRNAAFLIADNIESHGQSIPTMRYQQETASINAIIHDLEDTYAAQVNLWA